MNQVQTLPRAADMALDDIPYIEGTAISVFPPASEHYDDPFWYDQGGRDPFKQREIFKLPAGEELIHRLRGIVKDLPRYGPKMYEVAARAGRADLIRLLLELGASVSVAEVREKERQKREMKRPEPDDDDSMNEAEEESMVPDEADQGEKMDVEKEEDEDVEKDEDEDEDGEEEENDKAERHSHGANASDEDDIDTDNPRPSIEIDCPLHEAAYEGHLECVQVLVEEAKIPVDERDNTGATALMCAAVGGHANVASYLLSKNASLVAQQDGPRVASLAARSGNLETLNAILASEQGGEAGFSPVLDDLAFAAQGANVEILELVLNKGLLPSPTGSLEDLTADQQKWLRRAVIEVISHNSLLCLHLLLPYATRKRPDGSYQYFRGDGDDLWEIGAFDAIEDAMETKDDPELFQIVWETMICAPGLADSDLICQRPFDDSGKSTLTKGECLNRRLISAADYGRVNTVKLLHQRYGANVNHVSHKYFTTPLGRAAGSGLHDLPGRLAVARYLLEETDADINLASSGVANGETPLARALNERQADMVNLLLDFGGPVESIDEEVYDRAKNKKSGKVVEFSIAVFPLLYRYPVRIISKQKLKTLSARTLCTSMRLKRERNDLLKILDNMRIRKSDEHLLQVDPKGRPLMPNPPWGNSEDRGLEDPIAENEVA